MGAEQYLDCSTLAARHLQCCPVTDATMYDAISDIFDNDSMIGTLVKCPDPRQFRHKLLLLKTPNLWSRLKDLN